VYIHVTTHDLHLPLVNTSQRSSVVCGSLVEHQHSKQVTLPKLLFPVLILCNIKLSKLAT